MWHEAFVKGWLMRKLEDMRLFRALGVSQSLAAAGRLRNRTPSAVTVRLQRIEARMGLRLVTRAAGGICAVGGISLTNEGQHLIQEAIEILERIESISSRVSGESSGVSGHLRVVAQLTPHSRRFNDRFTIAPRRGAPAGVGSHTRNTAEYRAILRTVETTKALISQGFLDYCDCLRTMFWWR